MLIMQDFETIENKLTQFGKKFKITEELVSGILGLVVLFILSFYTINYLKQVKKVSNITQEAAQTVNKNIPHIQDLHYQVKEGDDLTVLAEKFYHNPQKWIDIFQKNKLTNADILLVGQDLIIPNVNLDLYATKSAQLKNTANTNKPTQISESTYIVQPGDTLESIAERAYGDQSKWMMLAQVNNLGWADHIEIGQQLLLPR